VAQYTVTKVAKGILVMQCTLVKVMFSRIRAPFYIFFLNPDHVAAPAANITNLRMHLEQIGLFQRE